MVGEWLRVLGLVDRRPFRDRLMRWWIYGVMALVCLGLLPLALSGSRFEHPDAARQVGLVALLPLGLLMLWFTWVAWKHQRF